MPMRNAFFFLCGLVILFISGCKKDPISPSISVVPGDLHVNLEANQVVEFDVKGFAGDHPLSRILIQQKPIGGVTTTILDTAVSGQQTQFFFVYSPPAGIDDVAMIFRVEDSEGYDGETARRVFVEGNSLLSESTGHRVYSKFSSESNAFDLNLLNPLFLSTNPDSSTVDLVELDLDDDGSLSNTLWSYSGVQFVRNNAFNYPEATNASAQATFESSTPLDVVTNVNENDVLISRIDSLNEFYAVIKITDIVDQVGDEEDYYEFNVKKLP